jgi:hypothetical protein
MRTFNFALGIVAVTASLAAVSPAAAQRNARRATHRPGIAIPENPAATVRSAAPAELPSQPDARCRADCGDYVLAVVSALLPSETAGTPSGAASDVVTLVVENRGSVSAPASVVSVAPRNRLTLARYSSIPSLAPGQRATIQLPVSIGADGTPCVSITITPAPAEYPAPARLLAEGPPVPDFGFDGLRDWGMATTWGGFLLSGNPAGLGILGAL